MNNCPVTTAEEPSIEEIEHYLCTMHITDAEEYEDFIRQVNEEEVPS